MTHTWRFHSKATHSGGFSLIEVLVVIGVVGILLALALPALRGARGSAREAACLANLHGLGTTAQGYLEQFAERYPFARAGDRLLVVPDDGREPAYVMPSSHWDVRALWPALMHATAPWNDHFPTWVCSGSRRDRDRIWVHPGGFMAPSYSYSNTFIARPETWTGAGADPRLLAPVLASDVLFPSSKVLFFDTEMAHVPSGQSDLDLVPVSFADGHAATKRASQALKPATNPFNGLALPFNDTSGGARGRDY